MNYKYGFSLIELMITTCIIGILSAIAYPLYADYINQSRRVHAEQNLLLLSQSLEIYYHSKQSYLGADLKTLAPHIIKNEKDYSYKISELTAQSFQITASPKFKDKQCGTLSLDQIGEKSSSGKSPNSECW